MFSQYNISDRSRVTLHCQFNLLSPLSHIGDVTGNVSNLKTVKLLDLEGNPRQCFVYSGNAIRNGILRRVGVASSLSDLGLMVSPDVHHTMFAGGRIDGSTGSDMELDTKIRTLMPWLSVLGTAKPAKVFGVKDAQMVQGRVNVGSGYLICYESAEYIYNNCPGMLPSYAIAPLQSILQARHSDPFTVPSPNAIAAQRQAISEYLPVVRNYLKSWTEYITIDQTTRRDSTLDPTLHGFLEGAPPAGQMSLLDGLASKSEGKKPKSDQMIASDRLIMAGAQLYSRWDLNCTSVEEGWIYNTLLNFANYPYIGGKGNRGNGLVSLKIWYRSGNEFGLLCTSEQSTLTMSDRFQEQHQRYTDYINEYKDFLASAKESSDIKRLLDA